MCFIVTFHRSYFTIDIVRHRVVNLLASLLKLLVSFFITTYNLLKSLTKIIIYLTSSIIKL